MQNDPKSALLLLRHLSYFPGLRAPLELLWSTDVPFGVSLTLLLINVVIVKSSKNQSGRKLLFSSQIGSHEI